MWWNRYIGTPFKAFGRTMEGCDCWGLLRIVYREAFGIELPSYVSDYTATDARQELAGLIVTEPEPEPEPELGGGLNPRGKDMSASVAAVVARRRKSHFI